MIAFSRDYRLYLCDRDGTKPEDIVYTITGDGLSASVHMYGSVNIQPTERGV